mgnify:CR=1 FL=1
MFILHLEPPHHGGQGDHQYRTAQPCQALGMLDDTVVVSGNALSPLIRKLIPHADVLVQCLTADHDFLPLLNERHAKGLLNVFEINDNYLAVQPWNPAATFFQNPSNQGTIASYAASAHLLQFSMPELSRYFGHFNSSTAVFKNNLWETPKSLPKDSEKLWLGWAGSLGHLDDIKKTIPLFKRLLKRYPQMCLAIMAPKEILQLFDWVERKRFKGRGTGPLNEYLHFIQSLHIGLCPLQETDFNLCRSDVKFLEYAAHKVFPICADLPPYQEALIDGERGLFFKTEEELENAIDRAIKDDALRQHCVDNAYSYVCQNRIETNVARERRDLYHELLKKRPPHEESAKKVHELFGQIQTNPSFQQPNSKSNYWKHEFSTAEALLYNGLLEQNAPKKAKKNFRAAQERNPNDYLPHLYLANIEENPEQALLSFQRALKLEPKSCTSHLLMGYKYLSMGQNELALEALNAALQCAPNYAPALNALGDLAANSGHYQEAYQYYEQAYHTQPFYQASIHKICSLLLQNQEQEQASELLSKNLELNPRDGISYLLKGQILFEQTCFEDARLDLEKAINLNVDQNLVLPLLGKTYLQLGMHEEAKKCIDLLKEQN